jgi:glyoxylase-like metal-dependent hydrolase (beta-lactamase superfamily II)
MTRYRGTLAILTIGAAAALVAQPQIDPAAVRSYERARGVLDAAVAAMYGPSGIDGLQNIAFRYEGDLIHRNQSAKPEAPYDRTPTKGYVLFDSAGARLRVDDAGSFPGGFDWDNRYLLTGRDAANIDLLRKRLSSTSISTTPAPLDPRLRRLSHSYLAAASDRARSLRFAGTRDVGGRPHDDIAYSSPDGRTINLLIDQKARTLTRAEWVVADSTAGDTVAADVFPEYRPAGQVLVPLRRIAETAGEATLDVRHSEFAVNQADTVLASAFERPTGFEPLTTDSPAEQVTVLAPHVRMIRAASGYNTLLVELADYAVLVEAPSNDGVSEEVLRTARARFGKPVRFVAATHHHDDHAGGARFYMAQGLTFVTTPGNVAYFEQMARRRSTLFGDRPIDKPRIETVSGRRSFSDGQTTVELIDIGRGPHANEMLIAYVPRAKIVFQGDLLNRPADGRIQPGNATTVHFGRRLRELGIDFDLIAGVHGPPASREEFERILQMTDKGSF